MYIPMNFTLDEMIKYTHAIPDEVVVKIEQLQQELEEMKAKVEQADRIEERLREQVQFRDNYIEEIMSVFAKAKSKQELIEARRYAQVALENSYIELDSQWGVL